MGKRIRSTLVAISLIVAVGACADAPLSPAAPLPDEVPARLASVAQDTSKVVPGRFVVVFNPEVRNGRELAGQLARAHGGEIRFVYEYGQQGFSAELSPAAVEAIRRNPNVAYVQPVLLFHLGGKLQRSVPSWGIDRIDERERLLTGTYTYGPTAYSVRAYVIDTGILTSHAEFEGRASVGYDASGGNGQDCHGHGTHVAGTIGGKTYGVAKKAQLISVRVAQGCTGSLVPSDQLYAAIKWVAQNHVKPAVANMSIWGPTDPYMDQAVQEVVAAGVTFVAIAGNNYGQNACNYSPSRVGEAITVGSSTSTDARADHSNIGSCVDLFAPGSNITSAWSGHDTDYRTDSGTSYAAPHVAGVAALYLGGVNSSASPATVRDAIVNTATPNRLTSIGSGSPNKLLHSYLYTPAALQGADIGGPNNVSSMSGSECVMGQPCLWEAMPLGGNGSYSYRWQVYYRDTGTTQMLGTAKQQSLTINHSCGVNLTVTITSGTSSISTTMQVKDPWLFDACL